ncbi:hypothetical protein PMAYCL1PPCAC_24852, partial [Pristionchus mayeri]
LQFLLDIAEEFLLSSTVPELAPKLLLPDKYGLIKLQDHCINELKTLKDVKEVKKAPEFKDLSDATKFALMEKMFKLIPE